jgi:hypothetical protein
VIAGINQDETSTGFGAFTLRPIPGLDLAWVKAVHRTIRGPLAVEWRLRAGRFVLAVTVPPNMSARLMLPFASASKATESGIRLAKAEGVRIIGRSSHGLVVGVVAGSHHFSGGEKRGD